MLLSAQLPAPHGLSKSALYISTEAPLATTRLAQLLNQHPRLTSLPPSSKPSLSRILSIQTPDLESQDHILRYQLPVAIQRHNVGLVVLDSVAANYRAEFERGGRGSGGGGGGGGSEKDGGSRRAVGEAMAHRTVQLVQLGALLRSVARTHGVAVVVANQVSDRFSAPPPPPPPPSSTTTSRHPSYNSTISQTSRVPTPGPGPPSQQGGAAAAAAAAAGATSTPPPPPGTAAPLLTLSRDPLTLDHQQRWFTGWGDARVSSSASEGAQNLKTPALGLVWANQIAARIALLKAPVYNAPNNPWIGLAAAADGRADWRRGEGGDGEEEGGSTEIKRWRRWMKVVFAPWAPPSVGRGVEYVIQGRGVAAAGAAAAVAEAKAKVKEKAGLGEEGKKSVGDEVEEKKGVEDEVEEEDREEQQVKEGEDSPAGEQQPRAGMEPLADSN